MIDWSHFSPWSSVAGGVLIGSAMVGGPLIFSAFAAGVLFGIGLIVSGISSWVARLNT